MITDVIPAKIKMPELSPEDKRKLRKKHKTVALKTKAASRRIEVDAVHKDNFQYIATCDAKFVNETFDIKLEATANETYSTIQAIACHSGMMLMRMGYPKQIITNAIQFIASLPLERLNSDIEQATMVSSRLFLVIPNAKQPKIVLSKDSTFAKQTSDWLNTAGVVYDLDSSIQHVNGGIKSLNKSSG